MIKLQNVKKYFLIEQGWFRKTGAVIKAVDDVSLEVNRGEVLGLVGESGCGKSTLGKLITGLIGADSGRVMIDGENIESLQQKDNLSLTKKIQIIFQDPYNSLDPRLKIQDIILEGLYLRNVKRLECDKKLKSLMEMVGLSFNLRNRLAHQFSGGQRQRIAIARALAVEPEFIVLDEPVSNLDVSIQAQILNLFLELHNRLNLTYLFISHDIRVVHWISDRIAVMQDGKIAEIIPQAELFKESRHPYTRKLIADSV